MRTLLCQDNTGEFKIEVPDDAHITFGPDVPFEKGYEQKHYSLRVYDDATKKVLIGVFCRVHWVRDLQKIQMARLVVREEGKSLWKSDETGYEASQSVKRTSGFVDSSRLLTGAPQKRRKK